jgi:hypothetical protein
VNFTRCIVGDSAGGEGDSVTGFADDWNWDLAAELHPLWTSRGLLAGSLIDADHLVETIDAVLRGGASVTIPSITVAARPPAPS